MVIIQKVIYIFVETFNNRTMNHLTFQERLSDMQIPAFVRRTANRALTYLQSSESVTIRVEPFAFWQMVRYSGAEPIKSGLYTFIRIYDDQQNAVDIQTLNS